MFYIGLLIGLVLALLTYFTRRILLALEDSDPDILTSVGIIRVDWQAACLAGIFRLAFGRNRILVKKLDRTVLMAFSATYAIFLVLGVSLLAKSVLLPF